jgi:hypothetical protein
MAGFNSRGMGASALCPISVENQKNSLWVHSSREEIKY